MGRIAIATLQCGWDCRWADEGAGHVADRSTHDGVVCTREGAPRSVHPSTCETCDRWELRDTVTATSVAVRPAAAAGVTDNTLPEVCTR